MSEPEKSLTIYSLIWDNAKVEGGRLSVYSDQELTADEFSAAIFQSHLFNMRQFKAEERFLDDQGAPLVFHYDLRHCAPGTGVTRYTISNYPCSIEVEQLVIPFTSLQSVSFAV